MYFSKWKITQKDIDYNHLCLSFLIGNILNLREGEPYNTAKYSSFRYFSSRLFLQVMELVSMKRLSQKRFFTSSSPLSLQGTFCVPWRMCASTGMTSSHISTFGSESKASFSFFIFFHCLIFCCNYMDDDIKLWNKKEPW